MKNEFEVFPKNEFYNFFEFYQIMEEKLMENMKKIHIFVQRVRKEVKAIFNFHLINEKTKLQSKLQKQFKRSGSQVQNAKISLRFDEILSKEPEINQKLIKIIKITDQIVQEVKISFMEQIFKKILDFFSQENVKIKITKNVQFESFIMLQLTDRNHSLDFTLKAEQIIREFSSFFYEKFVKRVMMIRFDMLKFLNEKNIEYHSLNQTCQERTEANIEHFRNIFSQQKLPEFIEQIDKKIIENYD